MSTITMKEQNITACSDFKENGYLIIETPALSTETLASFDHMPRDEHSLKRLREIRLSQYFGYWEEGQWIFALLPQRKYIQSAEYIKIAEAGGVLRHREQLEIDPSKLISSIFDNLPLNHCTAYQINVNQIRVIVNSEFQGITVPEGPHRDGHEYSVIAVAHRKNVTGGETQIIDPITKQIVHRQVLQENQAILIDDQRYIHYATEITPTHSNIGLRDIWVIEINQWEKRAYGPKHERLASAELQ
jgi:hypothetical protein